ncbi:MAG: DNA-directed RNA polymerase subunit omega [Candidatus Aminicenantes bacterium]|nr:DNA-directed RNA polymerase subunit omega [Candidatus Aminicenantes bacterium]
MRHYGDVDSKFRFVILASKRAKQLLKGAKPKIKLKSTNPIRIAQMELQEGVIEYDIVADLKEETPAIEEQVFLGDDLGGEIEAVGVGGELDASEDGAEAGDKDEGDDEEGESDVEAESEDEDV